MSLECGECERDLRGPHDPSCSHYKPPARCRICSEKLVEDDFGLYCPTHGALSAEADPYAALSQHLHGDGDNPIPQPGEQWRHHSGRIYTVLFLTNNEGDGVKDKYPVTVVYQGDNGKRWSGPLSDWHRRMTRLAEPSCATPGCANRPVIRLDDRRLCQDCYANHVFGDDA